ncbi:MAG: hypothetical protein A2776_03140 [Candidatus Levybacteria bacterium RIFCSPHIGHO2_01_FULL_40_10]|nr:MAG: hypothetical protein A2776_03140 [Candidatus Levybacteria bacterium RIFCSPHIGHO2_01_FULL_40_10]
MKRSKTEYVDIWVEKSRLKDPQFWHMKAWQFASSSHFIRQEFLKIKDGAKLNEVGDLFNAINSTPYLTGMALELFMKGYLVYKGEDPEKIRTKIGHDLKKLREFCCRYKDKRFLKRELIFVTDRLGEQIMKDGGIRYPDVRPMGIYFDEFDIALKTLQEISGEIDKELTKFITNG